MNENNFVDLEIENKISELKKEIKKKRDASPANSEEKKYYRKLSKFLDDKTFNERGV